MRNSIKRAEKSLVIVGLTLTFLGFLGNKWVISRILVPDGDIESTPVSIAIILFQLALISLGLLIILFRAWPITPYLADLLIGLLLALLCTLGLDRGLGWLGYPAKYIPPLAHPPNFQQHFQNLEFAYEVKTNSQGIRYREVPLEKPDTTTRVVVVGDSFTEGVGVEAEQTFTSLLEKRFSSPEKPVEFINCGLAATWPMQYARILFHLCLNYEPDAVLIALYANDVTETVPSAEPDHIDAINVKLGLERVLHALWPRIYTIFETLSIRNEAGPPPTAGQTIDMISIISQEARQREIPEAEITAWAQRLPPELVAAVNRGAFNGQLLSAGLLRPGYWVDSLDIPTAEAEAQYQVMRSILDEMIRRLQARQIAVGVIFIPSAFQYDPDYGHIWQLAGVQTRSEWATGQTALERRLDRWAGERELLFLNLTPAYQALAREEPDRQLHYPMDGHWTPQGHAVAAAQIAAWLESWMPPW